MVSVKTIVLALGALAAKQAVDAAPIELNPYEQLKSEFMKLSDEHPARSVPIKTTYVVPTDNGAAKAVTSGDANGSFVNDTKVINSGRRLEDGSQDLQRLQDYFKENMVVSADDIVKNYRKAEKSPVPWPGSYWPVYQDGINVRWDPYGAPSAAEKYAKAFKKDVKKFMDAVSARSGIDSQSDNKACTKDSDCASLGDGSSCGMRYGKKKGYCIPTWFGVCHAWTPAAILEDEPKCPVTHNGVKFEVFDLKGLITQIYDDADIPTVFTGARYNGPDDDKAVDKYGRYTDPARRDIGAGFFHIALANIMARHKLSAVVDVDSGSQVWNQPIRGYEIVTAITITPGLAGLFFFNTPKYPFNENAKSIQYVRNRFKYIVESGSNEPLVSTGQVDESTKTVDYTYLLELDEKKNIIGGEWIGNSRYVHPDFLWFPGNKPDKKVVTGIGLSYADVSMLLEKSVKGNC